MKTVIGPNFELPLKEAAKTAVRLRAIAQNSPEMTAVLTGALGPYGGLPAETSWRDIYAAAIAQDPPLWLQDTGLAAITTCGFFDPQYLAPNERIKTWARAASGADVLFILNYLETKEGLSRDEAYAFAHLASRSGTKIDAINNKLKNSGVTCFNAQQLSKYVFEEHLSSFLGTQEMPDFIDLRAFRKLFKKLVSLTTEHGIEYSQTGWIVRNHPQYAGKLIFADLLSGTPDTVKIDLHNPPKNLTEGEKRFAEPQMIVHTHPGKDVTSFHFSDKDFEALLKHEASSIVMLNEQGAGLIAFAGTSKKLRGFLSPASDIRDVQLIFQKHLPEDSPLTMAGLGKAAVEVCEKFGISLYLFHPDSDIAECMHKEAF